MYTYNMHLKQKLDFPLFSLSAYLQFCKEITCVVSALKALVFMFVQGQGLEKLLHRGMEWEKIIKNQTSSLQIYGVSFCN